LPCT